MIRVSRLSGESATLLDALMSRHTIGIPLSGFSRMSLQGKNCPETEDAQWPAPPHDVLA